MKDQGRSHFQPNQITGIIGEHYACVDLIKQGYATQLAGAGFPYDVVAEIGERIYRVQVKSTEKPHARNGYIFYIRKKNKGSDIIALVAVDTGLVGYLPSFKCDSHNIHVKPKGKSAKFNKRSPSIDELTLERALKELHEYEQKTQNTATNYGQRQSVESETITNAN